VCDRTFPACQKCGTRSLKCPGYGVTFKWTHSVASRGRLRGLQVPLSNPAHDHNARPTSKAPVHGRGIGPSYTAEHHEDNGFATNSGWEFGSLTNGSFIQNALTAPSGLSDSRSRRLLHHYCHVVAPQMAWIDSFQNPFRTILLPLAVESPAVLSSILAISDVDICSRHDFWSRSASESSTPWSQHLDQALGLLAERLRHEREQGDGDLSYARDQKYAISILAAIIVLCLLEVKWAASSPWRLHLRAAWAVIRHWTSNARTLSLLTDNEGTFLIQEVFAMNVWTSVTTFTPDDEDGLKDIDCSKSNAIFMDYLEIIQAVTKAERALAESDFSGLRPFTDLDMLHVRLDRARERTLGLSHTLTVHSRQARQGCVHLVEMFHYATLIYGYQVLGRDEKCKDVIADARGRLFDHLRDFSIAELVVHDLAWPLFIAGTECCGRCEDQAFVERIMHKVIQLSGPLDRRRMLQFLKSLWDIQIYNTDVDWIKLARIWAQRGENILIL